MSTNGTLLALSGLDLDGVGTPGSRHKRVAQKLQSDEARPEPAALSSNGVLPYGGCCLYRTVEGTRAVSHNLGEIWTKEPHEV